MKSGAKYKLIIDGENIKDILFLKPLTDDQKQRVIDRECEKLCISNVMCKVELCRVETKWDYKVNHLNSHRTSDSAKVAVRTEAGAPAEPVDAQERGVR